MAAETTTREAASGRFLEGSVALVTGASRGIGAATAKLLARHGATVGVNFHRSRRSADALVAEIEAGGGRALPLEADVTDADAVGAMVETAESTIGPIDILVCSASGITNPARAPFLKLPLGVIEGVVLGQLRAVVVPIAAVAPRMIERSHGSIVVVTSSQVLHPADKFMALAMAKGSIEVAVRSMSRELGPHGIRVNAVAPGLVLSDATRYLLPEEYKQARAERTPLRRLPLPEDIAGPIVLVASGMAGFVTGATLQVNGGLVMG